MRAWHGRRSFVLTRPHRSQAGIVLALFEQPPSTLVVTRHTLPLPPPHIISHTHTQCTPSCRCTPCSRLASCPHFWCACARTWCEQLTGQAKRRLAEAPSLARTSGPSAVRQPQQPCLAQSRVGRAPLANCGLRWRMRSRTGHVVGQRSGSMSHACRRMSWGSFTESISPVEGVHENRVSSRAKGWGRVVE